MPGRLSDAFLRGETDCKQSPACPRPACCCYATASPACSAREVCSCAPQPPKEFAPKSTQFPVVAVHIAVCSSPNYQSRALWLIILRGVRAC